MSELRIFVDFNNRDSDDFLKLNLTGTLEDLRREHLVLEEGIPVTGSDGDLTAKIIVVAPGIEGVWRGRIVDGPWEEGA